MDAERWRRARALFDELADVPAALWPERLQVLCPDDAEVRNEARALLEADAKTAAATGVAAKVMDAAAEQQERLATEKLVGTRVGPYSLLRQIGRGGMGQVWLAERADGEFDRKVAIKLIRAGWDAEELLGRFRAERQILAGLAHPNIAHLVDGGVTDDGKPWLALEYVEGANLREYCAQQRLDLDSRLRLFLTICDAVAYAHARLVVHRDLKPSNLLVDRSGQVKLLDFGIAKLIDADSATSATRLFTPEYAAPEQVRGEVVTTAVDVYALGLLLYELLTGRHPYKVENSTPAAYERAILDQEPTRPSIAVTRLDEAAGDLAAQRHLTPSLLARELRGDLDAVVMKALRKEPAQRYASAADFAADVQRYRDHRPVLARRGGWKYRAGRFLRRHALAAGLALFAALALLGGIAASTWQAHEARVQRDAARQALGFMTHLFDNADPGLRKKSDLTVRDLLDEGARDIHYALADQAEARGGLLLAMASAYLGIDATDQAELLIDEAQHAAEANGYEAQLAEALRLRCMAAQERNRIEDCKALLDRAESLFDPRDPAQLSNLVQAIDMRSGYLLHDNRHEDVVTQMRRALALVGNAPEFLRRREELSGTLSYSLIKLGRAREAEEMLRPLVETLEHTPDLPPRVLADALDNLARAVSAQGRRDEGLLLSARSLDLMEKLYGADNPIISVKLSNYAVTLYETGQLEKAEPLLQRVVAMDRAAGEPRLRALVNSLNNYGALEFQLGHDDVARAALDEGVAASERANVPMFLGRNLRWRGVLSMSQGRYPEARADFERSSEVLGKLFDANHLTTLRGRLLLLVLDFAEKGRAASCVEVGDVSAKFATADGKSPEAGIAQLLQALCASPPPVQGDVEAAFRTLSETLPKADYRRRYLLRLQESWLGQTPEKERS